MAMRNSRKMRIVIGLVIVTILVFLTGCNSERAVETENNPVNGQVTPTEEEKPSKIGDEANTVPYQLKQSTYEKGNIIVHFPQLTEMENITLEQQINEFLKREILQFVHQYENGDATLEIDYGVMTDTQDTLSILYTGYYSGGAYPSHLLFTTNIDLRTGEKIRLFDKVSINEDFIKKFNHAPYIIRENPTSPNEEISLAVKEYLNQITQEELIKAFKQADLTDMTDNAYGVYSYFQDGALVISIQVPHVIGDHAEFKME